MNEQFQLKASNIVSNLYNVLYIESFCQNKHKDLIHDIYQRRVDGVVIKKFLDPDATTQLQNCFRNSSFKKIETPFGQVLGNPLFMARNGKKDYFLSANETNHYFDSALNSGLIEKLNTCFWQICGDRIPCSPSEEGENYLFGSFRSMLPNKGGLISHTGNEFVEINKPFGLNWLFSNAQLINGLSYFILAKKPTHGGELILFDALYNDNLFGDEPLNGSRNDKIMSELKCQIVELQEGDMVIFNGGEIWHRVADIRGSENRLTFGGFMAISNDDKQVWYWS